MCVDMSSDPLRDQLRVLPFFTPSIFSGLEWPPGQHLSKVFKGQSTSHSYLGQRITDRASRMNSLERKRLREDTHGGVDSEGSHTTRVRQAMCMPRTNTCRGKTREDHQL